MDATALSLFAPVLHATDLPSAKAAQCDNPWGCFHPSLCADTWGLLQKVFAEISTLIRTACEMLLTECLPGGLKLWGMWGGWAEASGNVLSFSCSSPTFLLSIAHPAWANKEPPVYRVLESVSKPSSGNLMEFQRCCLPWAIDGPSMELGNFCSADKLHAEYFVVHDASR